jgi:hypothetical protein
MRLADQVCFQLGQLAFAMFRIQSEQLMTGDKAKDGIAKKLELFIVWTFTLAFASVRTMRQSLFQQLTLPELVVQLLLQ